MIKKARAGFGSHKSATTSRGTKKAILTTWGPINRFATVFTILINTFLWENFRLGAANAHMARLFMNIGFSPSRKGRQQFFPFCGWVNIMQQFFFFRSPFRKNEATPIKTEFLGAGLYGSPCFEWKAGLNKFSFASLVMAYEKLVIFFSPGCSHFITLKGVSHFSERSVEAAP